MPERWYMADHYDSDRSYHTYCGTCFDQIPPWLLRYSSERPQPSLPGAEPLVCDGCDREVGSPLKDPLELAKELMGRTIDALHNRATDEE